MKTLRKYQKPLTESAMWDEALLKKMVDVFMPLKDTMMDDDEIVRLIKGAMSVPESHFSDEDIDFVLREVMPEMYVKIPDVRRANKGIRESLMSDIADILKEALAEAGFGEENEETATYSVVAEGKLREGTFRTINEARVYAERLYDEGARGEIMVVNNKTRDVVDEFVD